jgi:hypothetical protein
MMTDPAAVGRMIAWGLRPRQQPSRNADYAGLVARWHADDGPVSAEVALVATTTELRQRHADVKAQLEAAADRWTVLAGPSRGNRCGAQRPRAPCRGPCALRTRSWIGDLQGPIVGRFPCLGKRDDGRDQTRQSATGSQGL